MRLGLRGAGRQQGQGRKLAVGEKAAGRAKRQEQATLLEKTYRNWVRSMITRMVDRYPQESLL
jgi:hypothetical protein